MSRGYIEEGDIVSVDFNNCNEPFRLCHAAKVLNIPGATGDSWIFEDLKKGAIFYVSEGCTVSKLLQSNSDI